MVFPYLYSFLKSAATCVCQTGRPLGDSATRSFASGLFMNHFFLWATGGKFATGVVDLRISPRMRPDHSISLQHLVYGWMQAGQLLLGQPVRQSIYSFHCQSNLILSQNSIRCSILVLYTSLSVCASPQANGTWLWAIGIYVPMTNILYNFHHHGQII